MFFRFLFFKLKFVPEISDAHVRFVILTRMKLFMFTYIRLVRHSDQAELLFIVDFRFKTACQDFRLKL